MEQNRRGNTLKEMGYKTVAALGIVASTLMTISGCEADTGERNRYQNNQLNPDQYDAVTLDPYTSLYDNPTDDEAVLEVPSITRVPDAFRDPYYGDPSRITLKESDLSGGLYSVRILEDTPDGGTTYVGITEADLARAFPDADLNPHGNNILWVAWHGRNVTIIGQEGAEKYH